MDRNEVVLALAQNLFFMPRIEAAAQANGLEVFRAGNVDRLTEVLSTNAIGIALVDLELEEKTWIAMLEILGTECSPRPKVIAYGPHGEPDTLRKARDLGSDAVVIKRDFLEQLPELLASYGVFGSE